MKAKPRFFKFVLLMALGGMFVAASAYRSVAKFWCACNYTDDAKFGHIEAVRECLERGVDVDLSNGGKSALMWAAWLGRADVVRILVEHKAEVDLRSNMGETALVLAAGGGHKEVVDVLLTANANPNLTDDRGNSALHDALEDGFHDIAIALIDHGANTKIKTSNGLSELDLCRARGDDEMVRKLSQGR